MRKMSKECDVIRDLLPLYVDEACSEASAEKVKNHLAVCSDCYAVFQQMCSDTNEELLKKEKESILQRHEKKEKAKTTIKSISIVSAVLSILFLTVYIAGFINVVKVWCRESDMYSIEERKAAAEAIKESYDDPDSSQWLHSITYTTDEICKESLEYCNSFGKIYEECMVFQVRIDHKDWGWNYCCHDETIYLVKTEEGEWDVLTGSRERFLDSRDIPMQKYKKLPQK
jgi:predicted nucleic acid-binding Zn ribbon protein